MASILVEPGRPIPLSSGENLLNLRFGWNARGGDADVAILYVTGHPSSPLGLRAAYNRRNDGLFTPTNPSSSETAIYHSGDDQLRQVSGGDEGVSVALSRIPARVDGVIALLSIKSGFKSIGALGNFTFWHTNSFSGRRLAERKVRAEAEFANMSAACIGGIFRESGGNWSVHHLSIGSRGGLPGLLSRFGLN